MSGAHTLNVTHGARLEGDALPEPPKRIAFDLDHPGFDLDPEPFSLAGSSVPEHRWLRLTTDGTRALIVALQIEVDAQERDAHEVMSA